MFSRRDDVVFDCIPVVGCFEIIGPLDVTCCELSFMVGRSVVVVGHGAVRSEEH